ncbi:MAG TPA: TetR/AcrR family transcriptional regulator [Candidatus Elarobacter sp.]|jgi:AcrR family transcriptional regulator
MSGNAAPKRLDRRVERTRDRLGDALIALMREQPFENITVQHVLDRAGIGRSTFYAHFSDKHDLLLSDVDEFLEAYAHVVDRDPSDRICAVRELFAHIAEGHDLRAALIASGHWQDVLDLGQAHVARAAAARLRALPRSSHLDGARIDGLAQAFAGAFFALLTWWLDHRPFSADEADALFHRMVWSGIDAPLRAVTSTAWCRPG